MDLVWMRRQYLNFADYFVAKHEIFSKPASVSELQAAITAFSKSELPG